MADKRQVTFIMNPISGAVKKAGIPAVIEQTLDRERFNYSVMFTEHAGHATVLAAEARDRGDDIVVAVGGDGTINEVARSLTHSSTAMGIIPCGSGNGLARHLMLPLDVKRSVEIINQCEIHVLDYGLINGIPFFCTCGMGFDAFISKKFAEAGKRGPLTYMENVLKEGLRYKPSTYTIEDETGTHRYEAYLVSCANASQYGNNAYIAPQASMSDGLLDVIVMEPFGLLDAPQVSFDMMNKTLDKSSKIKTFKTRRVNIQRANPGPVHYDGDPIEMGTDIEVSLVEKGISIIVNREADKSLRKPNVIQNAFCDFFNDVTIVRGDISKQTRHLIDLNKEWLKKVRR